MVALEKALQRETLLTQYRRRIAAGETPRAIARDLGITRARLDAWAARYDGTPQSLADTRAPGRPREITLTPEETRELRALYTRTNRDKKNGSMTLAARLYARRPGTRPELAEAILRPSRATKHQLPAAVRAAMSGATHLVAHHRAPKRATWEHAHAPGVLRRHWAEPRRLHAGERESWDDGTINLCLTIPWPYGGDKCSDRHGVRVGRYQLILCHDDATSYCPGFTFVARPQSSYRQTDLLAAAGRLWTDNQLPDHVYFERATWESRRVKDFLTQAGVATDTAYMPRQKLIENYFNRLWTHLSLEPGQVGRHRGETEDENRLLARCQSGALDPRTIFLSLTEALAAIERAVRRLNQEPVESRHYGKWTPAERYAADLAAHPRAPLSPHHQYAWAPERREWTIRHGMAGGQVRTPLGISIPYHFAAEGLHEYEGRRVRAYFDPAADPCAAALELIDPWPARNLPAGHLITTRAPLLTDAPALLRTATGWEVDPGALGAIERAAAIRKKYSAAVRTEYRHLGIGGKTRRLSEDRDGLAHHAAADLTLDRAAPAEPPAHHNRTASPKTPTRDRMMEHLGINL